MLKSPSQACVWPKLFCVLIPDKLLEGIVILLLEGDWKSWPQCLRECRNTYVIFRPGSYVREKKSQMTLYPCGSVLGQCLQNRKWKSESLGRCWWERGEKSFWNSHALNSHDCFPKYRHWLPAGCWGGFLGPNTWLELEEAALPLWGSPGSLLCALSRMGRGALGGAGALAPRLPSWLGDLGGWCSL